MLNPDGTENTSSTFIGNVNPIRYRGYYFDADFGLYYLQTRYYDPETGRFISQDDSSYLAPEQINGLNLFAYCNNNPVNRTDSFGCFAISASVSVVIIAVAILAFFGLLAYEESQTQFLSNTITAVVDLTINVTEKFILLVRSIYDEIRKEISDYASSRDPKNSYNSYEKHHIVAQNDWRAEIARMFLKHVNIDINSDDNLVMMRKGAHKVVHSYIYYSTLTLSIAKGYFANGRQGVLDVLNIFKKVLRGL